MRRETLRLTLDCDNSCAFCAQKGIAAGGEALSPLKQLTQLRARADEITFVGGEPTLATDLAEAIAQAKGLGFKGIGIQTNGRRLAEPGYAATLAKAGLTDVHLSWHGPEPAVHDYHVNKPGAYSSLLAGAAASRSAGLTIAVTSVLTRSNYRVLAAMPRLLKAAGATAWLITIPRTAGALEAGFDRVMPRLGIALPFALHALQQAQHVGLLAWIQGAPACTLGPYAANVFPDAPRAYAPVCQTCPSKPHCPGLDEVYLRRFGGDELSAKETPLPKGFPAIARLFVGVGELGHPPLVPAVKIEGAAAEIEPAPVLTPLGKR